VSAPKQRSFPEKSIDSKKRERVDFRNRPRSWTRYRRQTSEIPTRSNEIPMNSQTSNISLSPTPRSHGTNAALVIALLASSSLFLACSGSSSSGSAGAGGEGGAEESTGGKSGLSGKPGTNPAGSDSSDGEGGAAIVNCDERPSETVELNQTIWQAGFKVTLGTATLQPQTPSCSPGILMVDEQFENRVDDTFSLDDAVLSFGGADRHQAKVPFAENSPDPLITLEPQVLPIKGKSWRAT
jgi:hypothetical protein